MSNSHDPKIHQVQTKILRELLFLPQAGYAELQRPTGLTSDHFNFHINKLVELGYVEKISRGQYHLTSRGKEHANKLDTDDNTFEHQPKVAVLLGIERAHNGRTEYLMQQRLKHPYFGFWGVPSGKIRWGETILETAARELEEETGLESEHEYVGLYHEIVYQKESGELLEDKIFHLIRCFNVTGELKVTFEGGRNEWFSESSARKIEPVFGSFEVELGMLLGTHPNFVEQTQEYSKDEF
jgi:8-oxo-dGTP pyrophosphatase MutT (NUDIX family)